MTGFRVSGGPRRGIVKSFRTTPRDGEIVIELAPIGPQPAIISGLEVLRE